MDPFQGAQVELWPLQLRQHGDLHLGLLRLGRAGDGDDADLHHPPAADQGCGGSKSRSTNSGLKCSICMATYGVAYVLHIVWEYMYRTPNSGLYYSYMV